MSGAGPVGTQRRGPAQRRRAQPPAATEDVATPQAGPDGRQVVQRRARAVPGDVAGVERAGGGPDEQVGAHPQAARAWSMPT